MARTTIRTEDVTDSEVTTAKMATDPTNASNLASGTVGSARMGSGTASSSTILYGDGTWKAEPSTDTSGLQDDIALLGFKVAANGSLARYNLVDQSIDAFEDASGVDASASTNEVRNASKYYYGETTGTPTISGNYDSSSTDGDYTWYKWTTATSSGSYTTDTAQDYEYLVVAGGAGGGGATDGEMRGGGGGAGGYRTATGLAVAATTISSITVGAGGAGGSGGAGGTDGNSSVFSTITSAGGGGGGSFSDAAADGGSGGGGGTKYGGAAPGGSGNTPSTSPVQGYDGGDGEQYVGDNSTGCGGGGGSSAVGVNTSSGNGGAGGAGTSSSLDGSATVRGGGGGGGAGGASAGTGGSGGGGAGSTGNGNGTSGTANTGGGGGGASHTSGGGVYVGGSGGSGIVIIRRLTSADVEGADMTLVSNAQTAESVPTNGDLVMTITNGAGTTTPNTDIKAYITRDGSDYTSAVTLVDQGDTGGHTILTANGVDLSGETSGTAMRWKITTHNQSASKTTRIQAVSLGWS